MFRIGNIEFNNNIFLAPMAGVTDLPFRVLCKKQGASLTCTEMISSKGLYYNDESTKKLMKIAANERPTAIQIFGSDPEIMGFAAKYVSQFADIVDINMGCPAPKVVKNGDGSKLLLNPKLVGEIVDAVVKNSSVPVTVKIRKGWDDNHINAEEVAKIIENNGASAITIHGRTREEFYSGVADWNIIKRVKESVKIPVIGNGDIKSCFDAKRCFEETGCDAVAVGRTALGNPWIFNEINTYLKTGQIPERPDIDEIKETILKHIEMLVNFKGEYTAVREMRKHIAWYVKGLPGATQIRNAVNSIESREELIHFIKGLNADID